MEAERTDAFTEGRLSRRAFVRQLVDDGMAMPDALALADSLVPRAPASAPVETPAHRSPGPGRAVPARPTRKSDLVIEFVGDGYLVYDHTANRMHSLNHTAAVVLELCTGENDVTEIARLLGRGYQLPSAPETATRECVESLFAEDLVR
jgi:hypothetical protein